jgi:hypothetical protein
MEKLSTNFCALNSKNVEIENLFICEIALNICHFQSIKIITWCCQQSQERENPQVM